MATMPTGADDGTTTAGDQRLRRPEPEVGAGRSAEARGRAGAAPRAARGSPAGSTSRREGDSLTDRVREAVASGCDLVVAAGGDGTVSAVADALAGTETPLGIVPLGTANVLAGELGIPLDLEAACALLAGEHALARIDAMELAGKHYVTQVGVGLDAAMIRDTPGEHKRRFGRVAYLWTAATPAGRASSSRRFTLTVDGVTTRPRAMQVLVANSGTLGSRPFRWGQDIRPDDGRLDVCVIAARTLLELPDASAGTSCAASTAGARA